MITATQLQTLTEKLARGSGSSPGQVTLKVPREHKLQKFTGVTDDYLIEDNGYCMLSEPSVLSPKKMQGISFYTTWRELPRKSCNCSLMWRKTPQKLYSSYYKAHLRSAIPFNNPHHLLDAPICICRKVPETQVH